jgi:hypothetical protein
MKVGGCRMKELVIITKLVHSESDPLEDFILFAGGCRMKVLC